MSVPRETTLLRLVNRRLVAILLLFVISVSCGINKPQYTIEDYVLVPNAKPVVGNGALTAFVFENNKKILPFQQFLINHYKLQTFNQREIPFTINEEQFILHVYDRDETDKYINTSDFVLKNQIPDASKLGNQSDFIVISVTNDKNEDCLKDDSLYQNIVIKYLKNLKEEYFSNDR
ncbi:hypothetical protein FLAN108750_13655 [Flavobacterium antarcticum]|uniref:hypothetical protein n=1 Tax=Flavobacterium antarcticum TaxID=271155 RepID=UPI00058F0E3B|nr:hypothetical protein [Flavobacterium antarcticum]